MNKILDEILNDMNVGEYTYKNLVLDILDELDLVEFIMAIEKEYNIHINDNDVDDFMWNQEYTLEDLFIMLYKKYNVKSKILFLQREDKLQRVINE